MRILALIALCFVAATAVPSNPQRIVGGSYTTIDQYPSTAAVLREFVSMLITICGGSILNNRSILTAAHCIDNERIRDIRISVGSRWATGGAKHEVSGIIIYPSYDFRTLANDIAILRSATTFLYNNNVQPGSFAGANYIPGNFQAVWAVGWGRVDGPVGVEELSHVELLVIDQMTCRINYDMTSIYISDSMLCSGWPSGGRGQCDGDTGSPVYHNGVIVGVLSRAMGVGSGCGSGSYPAINTRVSSYANWIWVNA